MRVVLNRKSGIYHSIQFNSTEHVHAEKATKQMRTDTLACMQKKHIRIICSITCQIRF
jgi:hypothetical protein